jgi:Ca2+-binding EF-hand superfamily protein
MEIIKDTMGHLKPVFDACDQNGDGFVKTADLLRLVQQHTDIASEVNNRTIFVFPWRKLNV